MPELSELAAQVKELQRAASAIQADIDQAMEAQPSPASKKPRPLLSNRQLEVLKLFAAGCSRAEIGERLGISPLTADSHMDIVRKKLHVRRVTGAVVHAIKIGLIRLEDIEVQRDR